jgi:hypothetical protein
MLKLLLGIFLVLIIIFIVPILVYGLLAKPFGMATPQGVSPIRFLLSTLIAKIGVAVLLTTLFYIAREHFGDKAILYMAIWLAMFVFSEVGQAIGPNYSWKYASAGILSELIYIPSSVLVLKFLFK